MKNCLKFLLMSCCLLSVVSVQAQTRQDKSIVVLYENDVH